MVFHITLDAHEMLTTHTAIQIVQHTLEKAMNRALETGDNLLAAEQEKFASDFALVVLALANSRREDA